MLWRDESGAEARIWAGPAQSPIDCFWTVRALAGWGGEIVFLPTGMSDIVLNLGDEVRVEGQSSLLNTGELHAFGPSDRSTRVRGARGIQLFGVRFKQGLTGPFFTPSSVVGGGQDLSRLSPQFHARALSALLACTDDNQRASAMADLVKAQSAGVDRLVSTAISYLGETKGVLGLDDLAASLGLSGRQLERRIVREVGLAPKKVARLARFRLATERLRSDPGQNLSELALSCGYFDQSHFTNDFRSLSGLPPGAHRRAEGVGFLQYVAVAGV